MQKLREEGRHQMGGERESSFLGAGTSIHFHFTRIQTLP
jgi:hypothetical protein